MKTQVSIRLGIALAIMAVALLFISSAQEALAQDKFKLKFQASWPAGSALFGNFKEFTERVKTMSAGRLEIEALPAGAVVPAFEVLDATSRKVIDGAHTWCAYWVGKRKAAVLFTGGPGGTFGMDFGDYMGWMFEGGGIELYNEFYQKELKLNVVPYPILPAGPQAFGWFKRPIKNWNDLKGMKCRETGMAGEVFQAAGMRVVNMPGGEILPAAERGVVDCAEWVTPGEDLKMGFHEIWKYYYSPGMHENTTVGELLINGDVWKSLSPDLKAIVEGAAAQTFLRWGAWFNKFNAQGLKDLQEKHKVNVMKTPEDILIVFLKTWDEIAKKESEKDPFFKKVLESQRKFAELVVPAKMFMYPSYDFAGNYYWGEKKAAPKRKK